MGRIILGAAVGFVVWSVVWLGSEKALSAMMPTWFGAHQTQFEAAVAKGGDFKADNSILAMNCIRGPIISILAGWLAAVVARESRRTPIVLVVMLVAFGLLIVAMSWKYVPVWYHVLFTALLIPMPIIGGKLRRPGGRPA